MAHLCAHCEHWCVNGIMFLRNKRTIFRCSDCNHETTLVRVPSGQEDTD